MSTTITRIETITAELVEKHAKIKIPSEIRRTMVEGVVFSKDDLEDRIVIWFTASGLAEGDRYECAPETTFEVIEAAPTQMTLPELVREFAAIRVQVALDQPHSLRRLWLVVGELKNRGALD